MYGIISGVLFSASMVAMVNSVYKNPDAQGNDYMGHLIMLAIFVLIFIGVRQYRNKERDGTMSFGQGFKAGLLMSLIASTIYVLTWLVYHYAFIPDFMEVYSAQVLAQTPAEELADKTVEIEKYKVWYKNPLYVILLTYAEILPLGILISFISALVWKKRGKKVEHVAT